VLGVAAAAGILGWVVARQVTRRLSRLTATAEAVASTGRLDIPVDVEGDDEAGRLAAAFNKMLSALSRSRDDQQRLVQDAGHELRTPLTSLRTNISVLRRHDRLSPETMTSVLDDLESEALELTELTNELVELATDRRSEEPMEAVVLGEVAERVAARARRRTGRVVVVDADASVVNGRPQLLERAITNLVDNAAKFDETGEAPIDVVIRAGRVEVLDRGPGIAEDDLPHLFDRFYRAVAARSRPGSGLGLAIVKAVAEAHGGEVFAANRPGGGADIGFFVPV
jgi:two-component system sensor histidine kinase MprB